jgi:transcriptional adapter 2-alpha
MASGTKKVTLKARLLCSTCNRQIGRERYVVCAKCPSFPQCLQCLSVGAQAPPHAREHGFVVVQPSAGALFREGWLGSDEIQLLHAIQQHGLGNWDEVAQSVRGRSALELQTHYFETYVRSPMAPFPLHSIQPKLALPPPPAYDTRPVDSCPSDAHERNMMQKNKKERTVPAEFNGYMRYRHEFELDFNNEAEQLVAQITFSGEDNADSFANKLEMLLSYNAQLTERRLRTRVIEDFGLQYQEVRAGKSDKDEPRLLGGFSPTERRIDSRLALLAPYLGAHRTEELAGEIHRGIRVAELIRDRRLWEEQGIRSHQEGHFFNDLMSLVKDGRVPIGDFERWNETMERWARTLDRPSQKTDLLGPMERALCDRERIDPAQYQAMKDLIIRESTFRQRMSRVTAVALCPSCGRVLGLVYDLLRQLGMVVG